MTRSSPRFRPGPGVLVLPTRLGGLSTGLRGVLLLDEIKTLIEKYNRATGEHLILAQAPQGGWCADCQSYVEAGQVCGCRS